jgi:hypothetical protein
MKIEFIPTIETGGDYPPTPMKKSIPDWYKETPTEIGPKSAVWYHKSGNDTNSTIKKCIPVLDFMSSGYVLRTQSEILLSSELKDGNQNVYWRHASSEARTVSIHPHNQCPIKIGNERKTYFKFSCGFIIKTPPGYSCIFYQSPYFMNEGLDIFSAIVDTDTYDAEILFPGYISSGASDVAIPPGTPLITVFPFKRDSWESETHEIPQAAEGSKFKKLNQTWLSDVYRRFFRQGKEYN